ncbi:MAG: hypothetical protein GF364_03695, partial [Candidatus Lokiarchaeota archaeon]|nr:hypothetical protein [Candidatus Lokiarchaeota archaeon]
MKNYRYGIDDNILFFKDLAEDPKKYPSLLDHWYLKMWHDLHLEYGTKIHLNIYYQTRGFNLSEFPNNWKQEWKSHSKWLNLSFHALQNSPPAPYKYAKYDDIAHDYDTTMKQVERFAGKEIISNTTTIHFTMAPLEAVKALQDRGIKILVGLFWKEGNGSYYLSQKQVDIVNKEGVWRDPNTNMVFVACAGVINNIKLSNINRNMKKKTKNNLLKNKVELMFHEQYFRKES